LERLTTGGNAVHNISMSREADGGTALADERVSYGWAQLDDLLTRAVNALQALDLGPERRVAIFAENAAEAVAAHLAGILAGASTVPVSFHLTDAEVAYVLEDSAAAVLLVGPETAATGAAAAAATGVTQVYGWRTEEPGVASWEELLAGSSTEPPSQDIRPLPHLHYTSGTTGRPKGVETPPSMFAGGGTVAEHLANIAANPMLALGGTALIVGPMYHTGPLSTVRNVLGGMGVVVLGRFEPEATLRAIQDHRITTTVMVPTHFQRLLALPADVRAKFDTSSLLALVHTGAACPVEVKRAMIDWLGPVLYEAYGGTEAGTTNSITSQEWLDHPGSVGRTMPPFEVVIVDEGGNEVLAGERGQIYFRDTTGRGVVFRNDPEKTESVHLQEGVFTLGEVGYVDSDGYLYITDRTSDMIVSGGVNIYPAEAEQALLTHPDVADVACIGIPHDEMGEQLHGLVVPADPSAPPGVDDLIEHCRGAIAGFKVPRSIELVSDLGRNAMGKINKRTLRAPYWPTERTIGG
jgi:long-chain acyl-CoA synthetase